MAALAVALTAWGLSQLFVKYLIQHGYDPHTQNFYRYVAGTLAILPWVWHRMQVRQVRLTRPVLWRLLGVSLAAVGHQVSWVVAMQWIYPALAAFLIKSSVLFAGGLVFLLYPEERWVFRSGRFRGGLGLALAGAAGLALLRPDLDRMEINVAVLLVLFSAAMWGTYSVVVKRVSAQLGPTVSFGVVGVYVTLILAVPAVTVGDLGHWREVAWPVNVVLVVSGILCIGVGHVCYYVALRALGVAVCTTMLMTTPLFTMLLSFWWFGERLTAGQIAAGIVLLAGGILTLLAKEKPAPVAGAVDA